MCTHLLPPTLSATISVRANFVSVMLSVLNIFASVLNTIATLIPICSGPFIYTRKPSCSIYRTPTWLLFIALAEQRERNDNFMFT